jgi:hypothetical protein
VSRKRITTWVLMLVVVVATRSAIAAPKATVVTFRAIVCCAEHCPKTPRRPMTPRQCCFVDSAASDPASTGTTPTLERPAAAPLAFVLPAPASVAQRLLQPRTDAAVVRAGPPLYLHLLQIQV